MTDPRHHGHLPGPVSNISDGRSIGRQDMTEESPQRREPIRVEWFSGIVEPSARAWFNEPWSLFAAFAKTRQAKGQSRNSEVSAQPSAPWPQKGLDVQKASAKSQTFCTEFLHDDSPVWIFACL